MLISSLLKVLHAIIFLLLGFLVALGISFAQERVELIHKNRVEIYLRSPVTELDLIKRFGKERIMNIKERRVL